MNRADKTSEESVDVEKINNAFSLLKEQNNYEILGVKENATEAETKKGIFQISKKSIILTDI